MIFVIVFLGLLILNYLIMYWLLLLVDYIKLKKLSSSKKALRVSVIIPFRNEVKNLQNFVKTLLGQTYPKKMFEVIFVNDHSTDNSSEIIRDVMSITDNSISLLELSKEISGKKSALEVGFKASRGDVIIQCDADVLLDKHWIKEHIEAHCNNEVLLVCGPVGLQCDQKWFNRMQCLEMDALMISTKLTINASKPVMCSGANLSFKREILNDVFESYKNVDSQSGDDVFLLHYIKSKYTANRIRFMENSESIVKTIPAETLSELISQRSRWAKKSKEYKDCFAIYFTATVALANISIILMAIIGASHSVLFVLLPFLFKWVTDFSLIYYYRKIYSIQKGVFLLFDSLVLEILYPFYVLKIGLNILISKQVWKGRVSG